MPGIAFTDATLEDCVAAAERFAARGDDWHNHVLKPSCIHNPRPGAYVLVIENNTTGEVLGHASDTNPVEAEQHIVRLRHGADIIAEDAAPAAPDTEPEILTRIRALAAEGADWHHHMILPACVLNRYPGRWLITLETADHGEIMEHVSDEEPLAVLRTIETLFFAQEKG